MSYCEMSQDLISLIFPILICNHPTRKFRVCLRLGSDIYNPIRFIQDTGEVFYFCTLNPK